MKSVNHGNGNQTVPKWEGDKYLGITENEKKFYTGILENQSLEKMQSFCAELGYEWWLSKGKDWVSLLGFIRDDSARFSDYGEYYLFLKYYFLGEGDPKLLGNDIATLVGNGVIIADYSVKNKKGDPVCDSALEVLNDMYDLRIVREPIGENKEAVYFLTDKEMPYWKFEQILSACAKVKLYAIAKNKYSGESFLISKSEKRTEIKLRILIKTMDPGILSCVPDVSSEEWNSTIEAKGKKLVALPTTLFCRLSSDGTKSRFEEEPACAKCSDGKQKSFLSDTKTADLYFEDKNKVGYDLFDVEPDCMKGVIVLKLECTEGELFVLDYIGAVRRTWLTKGTKYFVVKDSAEKLKRTQEKLVQSLLGTENGLSLVTMDELIEIARRTKPGTMEISLGMAEEYRIEKCCYDGRCANYSGLKTGDELELAPGIAPFPPELFNPNKGSLGFISPYDFDVFKLLADEWNFKAIIEDYKIIPSKGLKAESAEISVKIHAEKKASSKSPYTVQECRTKFIVPCVDPEYFVKVARFISPEVKHITFRAKTFVCTHRRNDIRKCLEARGCELASSTVLRTDYIIIESNIDQLNAIINRALELKGRGYDIKAVTEDEFWELLKNSESEEVSIRP